MSHQVGGLPFTLWLHQLLALRGILNSILLWTLPTKLWVMSVILKILCCRSLSCFQYLFTYSTRLIGVQLRFCSILVHFYDCLCLFVSITVSFWQLNGVASHFFCRWNLLLFDAMLVCSCCNRISSYSFQIISRISIEFHYVPPCFMTFGGCRMMRFSRPHGPPIRQVLRRRASARPCRPWVPPFRSIAQETWRHEVNIIYSLRVG